MAVLPCCSFVCAFGRRVVMKIALGRAHTQPSGPHAMSALKGEGSLQNAHGIHCVGVRFVWHTSRCLISNLRSIFV